MAYRTWGDYNRAQARLRQTRKADAAFLAEQAARRKARLGVSEESDRLLRERIARLAAEQDKGAR